MKNKIQNTLLMIALLSLSFAKSMNRDIYTVPIDLKSGRPILEVSIDGKGPYRFIFDTGASVNVIDRELADEMQLKIIGEEEIGVPQSDNVIISDIVSTEALGLHGTEISSKGTFIIMDLREPLLVDGILSITFLSDYLLTLDYGNSIINLSTEQLNINDKEVSTYNQDDGIINVNVNIDGNLINAHLDSGNPGFIDIPYSLKDKLEFTKEIKRLGTIMTAVDSFDVWHTQLDGNVEIGKITYSNPNINLVENFEFVNLGSQLVNELKISIDQKNKLIKFEKH